MKILDIVSSGFEEGGVENGVILMKPLSEARGHTVKIFSSDSRPDLPHFNDYTYRTPSSSGLGKFFYTLNPYAYRALKKVLREYNPDVVQIHTIGNASPLILFALRKYPTVLIIHGPEGFSKSLAIWCYPKSYFKSNERNYSSLNLKGKLRYFYQKIVEVPIYWLGFRNIDLILTLSDFMHNLMNQDGLKNTKVSYGTTLMTYSPPTKDKITYNLLYVGRLEFYKGVNYLIDALPLILQKFPQTNLSIAGNGGERAQLEKQVRNLNLGKHVTFLNHLNRSGVEKAYRESSILIVPSTWVEAFGKVGVEAMSVGRPVIASNIGGISDWLTDGKTGFLIPSKNSNAIAESVIRLFSNTDMLIDMSIQARKNSENFDLNKHVDTMEKIYKDLIISKS